MESKNKMQYLIYSLCVSNIFKMLTKFRRMICESNQQCCKRFVNGPPEVAIQIQTWNRPKINLSEITCCHLLSLLIVTSFVPCIFYNFVGHQFEDTSAG